jgi:hypothetical protein
MSRSAGSRTRASAIASAALPRSTSSPSSAWCTSGTRCPECGAPGAATSEACEKRFQDLSLERFDDSELATDWRLIVDCYSVQHDRYIASGRSLAAHLTGVCIALEHGGDDAQVRSVQRWLSGTRELAKPAVPAFRGDVTIDDVIVAAPEDRHAVVQRWADSVWAAWAVHQALARSWVASASRP